jgi:hypothetical protein
MTTVIREPSWLLAKIDQRVAMFADKVPADVVTSYGVVLTPLTEPDDGATREEVLRWDRTCDNCGAFVPRGRTFYTGHAGRMLHGVQVVITYGACPGCMQLPEVTDG